jgi:uncharacterized protein (DUF433 family)
MPRCGEGRVDLSESGRLLRNYPELEAEDIRQALALAAANLEDSASESDAA